jgi:excisionase family DNA binding protein
MTAQGETYQRLTVSEAAATLGVSRMTVRRMIQRGQLEAERVHRPQGTAYLVTLPVNGTGQGTPTAQPARHMGRPNDTEPPAQAEAMVSLIQATIGTILGPLVAEQTALRLTVERQADQLVSQAETVGRQSERVAALELENSRLSARLMVAQAAPSPLVARTAPQPAEPPTEPPYSRWRVWEPRLLALVTLAIAAALLAWLW